MTLRTTLILVPLLIALNVFLWFCQAGIFDQPLEAPPGPVYVKPVPQNWQQDQHQRMTAQRDYIANHQLAFDHFADFAVSQHNGIPLIILKLLPVLAPELWGDKDNFLSVIGLFVDERVSSYPFARGIGFSGLSRKEAFGNIDYASFTCGSCHIGRVRVNHHRSGNHQYYYIDGGINSQIDIIAYRRLVFNTLKKISQGETDQQKKQQRIIDAIVTALEQTHQRDPHYFYNNYSYRGRHFDAAYEAQQIALFKASAAQTIPAFIKHQEDVHNGWGIVVDKIYQGVKEDILRGFPGMEDAIGFSGAKLYLDFQDSSWRWIFAPIFLPSAPAITDIMSVWEQDTRNPRWNADNTRLINGGGQWNGHIPLPIYKNIGGQTTTGFDGVDIAISAFSEQLLEKLPASVYPFDVNLPLARQGQKLFAANCASCHQPNNGKIYQVGTDPGRSDMANTLVTIGARMAFGADDLCSTTSTVEMQDVTVTPCAQYRGVSLKGKRKAIMSSPMSHDGYSALPLIGIWARAPYFHNGSVPTIYHLLVPSERPAVFIKSRLDYDTRMLGFSWDPALQHNPERQEGYQYNTNASTGLSNKGHDTDIVDGDNVYKLNWEDDKAGAMAIIEYMKTL